MRERDGDLIASIGRLISLEQASIAVFEAALEHIEDVASRRQIAEFSSDHRGHLDTLRAHLERLGGRPLSRLELRPSVTRAKVRVGAMVGDRRLLAAILDSEQRTIRTYERAASRAALPGSLRAALNRILDDERRHASWLEARRQLLEGQAAGLGRLLLSRQERR